MVRPSMRGAPWRATNEETGYNVPHHRRKPVKRIAGVGPVNPGRRSDPSRLDAVSIAHSFGPGHRRLSVWAFEGADCDALPEPTRSRFAFCR
jgi:hypothetical protein